MKVVPSACVSQFSVDGNMSNISSLRTTAMAIKLNQFHTTAGSGVGGETPGGRKYHSADEEVKLKKKKRVPLDFGVFALLPENLVEIALRRDGTCYSVLKYTLTYTYSARRDVRELENLCGCACVCVLQEETTNTTAQAFAGLTKFVTFS